VAAQAPAAPPPGHAARRQPARPGSSGQAAQRIAALQAGRHASGEYTARLDREAQAKPEADHKAEACEAAEIEM
jgi:hypothetical protein